MKNFVYLGILTVVIVASWIGFSVYNNYTTSTISSDTKIRITPIPPAFDQETIENLRTKRIVDSNLDEARTEVPATTTPTPIQSGPILTPKATSSGQINL